MRPLAGRRLRGPEFASALDAVFGADSGLTAWRAATEARGVPGRRWTNGPIRGFYHDGWLGQYLVVLPRERLVAVRLVRRRPGASTAHEMHRFPQLVLRLFGTEGT
jgi:CubicO group peptidase (beta-lactamase class C family)